MTSEERREARYQRRKARRAANLAKRNEAIGTLEEAFNYRDMFRYGRICCNGVRWKNSVQRFEMHLFSITARQRRQVLTGKWQPKPYVHFMLRERGKIRPIDAPHIQDRQIHKTLVRNVLEPLYLPTMIYDNGASQRNKGLHFSYKRLKKMLVHHFKKYGADGGVTLADIRHFFPDAPRWLILRRHQRYIFNDDIRAIADQIVIAQPGELGMPLGVEPSQLEMVSLPSSVDNYLRCQRGINASHYMDDYHAPVPSKAEGEELLADMIVRFAANGMTVSQNKSRVSTIRKFKYCKATFIVTDTGKIVTHGNRDGMKRTRRKLKMMCAEVREGKRTWEAVDNWFISATAYYRNYNDHNRVLRLNRLYYALKHKEAA